MKLLLLTLTFTLSITAHAFEAACMSYEQGVSLGCTYMDSAEGGNFCRNNYGARYIPFEVDETCSMEAAAESRGEVSAKKLTEGLASDIEEIETIMTMVDRQGLNGVMSTDFQISGEFYTDVIKSLMAKMNMFKNRLYKRSQLEVNAADPENANFASFGLRYLEVLARLYRVYSAAAHENHFVLKTYTFENLEYLNLVLKKAHGLEILALVNFYSKNVNDGKDIEFIISHQERQQYEYIAMQSPTTTRDYAKLVTFLGLRETVTNLWGVQRMSQASIDNGEVRSCGNFLSIRPENNSIQQSKAYVELLEDDAFINEYFPRHKELAKASTEVLLLNEDSAKNLELYVFNKVPEMGTLVENTGRDLESMAQLHSPNLIEAERIYWERFSETFFISIVLRGDGVLNKENIIDRIVVEAYRRKVEAIAETFLGSYLWVSDSSISEAEKVIEAYAEKHLKESYVARLKAKLEESLDDYMDTKKFAQTNRSKKIEETLKVAKESAQAAYIMNAIKEKTFDAESSPILEPTSVEDLMMLFQSVIEKDYADLNQTLKHDEELSKELSLFFEEIQKAFEEKFPKDESFTKAERARGLREVAVEKAKKLIEKYPFIVKNPKTRNLLLCNENGTIPVFEDGTPAALSNEELLKRINRIRIGQGPMIMKPQKNDEKKEGYKLSDEELKKRIERIRIGQGPMFTGSEKSVLEVFGATEVEEKEETPILNRFRNNPDKVSLGTISKPLEIVSPGVIRTKIGNDHYKNDSLVRLFESFDLIQNMKKEKKTNEDVKVARDLGPKDLVINNPTKFFFRVLEVLELENAYTTSEIGSFAANETAQQILATTLTTQAYQMSPILRIESDFKKNKKKYCFVRGTGTPYRCDYKETVSISLLDNIALSAYSPKKNAIQEQKTKDLIENTIRKAELNASNKVQTYCNANFLNFKNDPNFKKVYKSSKYLRTSLKSPYGQTEETVKKIEKFDESIRKMIRSKSEAVNEDYLEPSLHILGTAALVALGIVLIIGSGGVAAPGIMGGAVGAASTFLAVEFFVSFPLMMGSLYSRINTHFIETPAQLKFQQSLATSQVNAKVVDWDMLKADKEQSSSSKAWTIGLMPLEFLYGAMLYRHVKVETGSVGKAAYKRLTGAELKGWSAAPASSLSMPSFSQMREHRGLLSASWAQMKKPLIKIKSYMPKYVPVPENMIRTTALRMGITRKAESLNVGNSPWELLKEIDSHSSRLKQRVQNYEDFAKASDKLESSVRLKGALKPSEMLKHFKESMISYMPRTLWQKIKSGSVRELTSFFTNFGEVWAQMKKAQGLVVGQRAKNIDSVAQKLRDFKKAVEAGHYEGGSKMEQFLRTLSDQEIMMLEEVARSSHGLMRQFKPVFKDYQKVLQGLRPLGYLTGYPGRNFEAGQDYPKEFFKGEVVDIQYAFKSDSEDLMSFYESFMKQQAVKSDELSKLREQLERELQEAIR